MIASTSDPLPTSTPESITESIAPPLNNAALFERLADVQLPAEPQLWPVVTASVITLTVSALLYFAYRRFKQNAAATTSDTAQQALARLTTVEQAWSNNEIEAREAAYQLSTLLRLGLNLPQLNNHCPAQLIEQQKEWQQTITLFNQLRYTPQITEPLTTETFEQLRQWLVASREHDRGEQNV